MQSFEDRKKEQEFVWKKNTATTLENTIQPELINQEVLA